SLIYNNVVITYLISQYLGCLTSLSRISFSFSVLQTSHIRSSIFRSIYPLM
ncbi:hypothetical protein L9F63_007324, partial [Diploptera punctata]